MGDASQRAGEGGSSALRVGGKVGPERFTLVKELGRGGMGVVWLAQDTHLGELVALKFLPPEVAADPVALNDLRRETVRSHRLTHPNIIRIHDFHQQADGVAFISMEYVDGMTLSGWRLQQPNHVFTWEQLAPLAQQLCTALEYAHGEGVIHRDLKPANMMLDSRGRVKLADFGIAAVVSDSMSRVSARSSSGGTLAYMSPQQITGSRPTATDDIYALGATIYELLTGRPPFYSGDITHQVLQVAPVPIGERLLDLGLDNQMPEQAAALIMACLAKEAEQRPAGARAVAEWLSLGISACSELVAEELPPDGSRTVFWWALGIGGVALTLVAVGLVVSGGRPRFGAKGDLLREEQQRATQADSAWHGDTTQGRWTNSLGMVFVPVPGTKVLSCIWETRVEDFDAYIKATGYDATKDMYSLTKTGWKKLGHTWQNPGFPQGPSHPVVGVSMADAKQFCSWLTAKEKAEARLANEQEYRLPTSDEWIASLGMAESDLNELYPWGRQWPPPKGAGNYLGEEAENVDKPAEYTILKGYRDQYTYTAPAGSFKPNALGIYDLSGNAWELCGERDEANLNSAKVRGACYGHGAREPFRFLCTNFMEVDAQMRTPNIGFRVALTMAALARRVGAEDSSVARTHLTNSLGMVFVPVPGTQARFSIWETRVRDFAAFADASGYRTGSTMGGHRRDGAKERNSDWRNPGFAQAADHPVVGVNWDEAQAFCGWLTTKEQTEGGLDRKHQYRLPTDAEWSQAVGTDKYPWGDSWPPPTDAGNYGGEETQNGDYPQGMGVIRGYRDGYARTSPVGSYRPNQFGLYDLGGNAWEWCADWYRKEMNDPTVLQAFPVLAADDGGQTYRVYRGGGWNDANRNVLLSANRMGDGFAEPSKRYDNTGFRCVLAPTTIE